VYQEALIIFFITHTKERLTFILSKLADLDMGVTEPAQMNCTTSEKYQYVGI